METLAEGGRIANSTCHGQPGSRYCPTRPPCRRASAIARLSNRAHKDEGHAACLEALKGEFCLVASGMATTTPRLLGAFLRVLKCTECPRS